MARVVDSRRAVGVLWWGHWLSYWYLRMCLGILGMSWCACWFHILCHFLFVSDRHETALIQDTLSNL
jgi:hypothetical protein